TSRQKEILQLIRDYLNEKGFPPTRADISRTLGFKSPNAAEQHLRAIEKKGFISILSGASRGIVLNKEESGIPVVGLVAAGNPILAEENIEKRLEVPSNMFSQRADFFLKVKGESMRDVGINEEDLIAVKKSKECKNGDIVVARINNEVTVKTFRTSGEGDVTLEPQNKNFKPIKINLAKEDFYLEGICVGVIKRF
ncbi:MAG: transcriptional repressor LexA, partial [Pseudomonadota bacterium]|nr:transcriptional repressor LexA [Pseudomonadota bacterium]